jgi:hypothetical protein
MSGVPSSSRADPVRFFLDPEERPPLASLPWNDHLERWQEQGVRMLQVRSGLSRHIVRFVESSGRRYAVKETTLESALREHDCYAHLTGLSIPTLRPVGVVSRDDGPDMVHTPVGPQIQHSVTGFLVTELMEKVIPDSILFRRGFSRENRARIWDAVLRLFVQLHGNGVYWGDASLANMLIHFSSEIVPGLGRRTRLNAVLADAETVEIHDTISDRLRQADLDFFLESMQWTEADLMASGIVRDTLMTQDDMEYLRRSYEELYAVDQEMRSFALVTRIDADRMLGNFDVKGYGKLLLKHIQEHKWYMSERRGREVTIAEAAEDWYSEVFRPVCGIFQEYGLLTYFPDKTASSLYVEIMEHKYFMSQNEKRDVGLVAAVEDYCSRFAGAEPFQVMIESIIRALRSLFTGFPVSGGKMYMS